LKTNSWQPQVKYLAKIFEILIKTIYMLLRAAEQPFDDFSHFLQNLLLKCLHFPHFAGFLFHDEWMQR